ncbi:hypothetical protein [Chryseobacterium sp. 3008163]|uniref:hypothetical protein n=1 Tax=Chryseobacterium sp. 3008163 TaxID=2478663 RepID=UPI000F0CEF9F|nr:hypothetical protein [Chryseobacterium sp. 3008163]AYN00860.1 hypothetical protein EAG08_11540 [Chryseobacterium sp. 3008163]
MKTEKSKFEKFLKKPMLNKDLLNRIKGGVQDAEIVAGPISSNCGNWYTISGECRKDGKSCWPF